MLFRTNSDTARDTPERPTTKNGGSTFVMVCFSTDSDRELTAKAIARYLHNHKINGTMPAAERRDAWQEVSAALGVPDATRLIEKEG